MRQSASTYRRFTDEEVEKANSVDIVCLAEKYGYEAEKSGRKALHMKHSGGLYLFTETNRFFQWTGADSGEKGGTINFDMREENLSFPEAVAKLLGEDYTASVREVKPYTPKPKEPVVLPEKAANFKRTYWYLVSVRGIDPQIVSFFMNERKVMQESKFRNTIFVGYDRDGVTPKYCSLRASRPDSTFKMD